MIKIKTSNFKMFEKAPWEIPEPRTLLELTIMGTMEGIKLFGPAYTPRFIKHALDFVSQKIGDKPPEDIKDLNQLAEYMLSISDKYAIPANAIIYASVAMGNLFEGHLAAGLRVGIASASRSVAKSLDSEKIKVDIVSVLSQYRQASIAMKIAHQELGYKRNTDESVDILWKCYAWDACQLALDNGLLKRPEGGLACVCCQFLCQFFKILTGYDCDYTLLEFDKSHCITRIHIL